MFFVFCFFPRTPLSGAARNLAQAAFPRLGANELTHEGSLISPLFPVREYGCDCCSGATQNDGFLVSQGHLSRKGKNGHILILRISRLGRTYSLRAKKKLWRFHGSRAWPVQIHPRTVLTNQFGSIQQILGTLGSQCPTFFGGRGLPAGDFSLLDLLVLSN